MADRRYDAVVVGGGPNGLAAAVTIARAGRSVVVLEEKDTVGGGARTREITLRGFWHDICSAVHPLGISSPAFRRWPLARYGLEWLHPEVQLAHPFDDSTAAELHIDIDATAARLGRDEGRYRALMAPLARDFDAIARDALGPILRPPRHPIALARFGAPALLPAATLAQLLFREREARALFTGMAGHAMVDLRSLQTASFGLMLGASGHARGWPVARGGSESIVRALAAYLRDLGGEIETCRPVRSLADLPPARATLFDVTPRQLIAIAGPELRGTYRKLLGRFRYGPGVFKVDYALAGPMPWTAEGCRRAGTVHLGGTMEEVVASEARTAAGSLAARPLVVVSQQTVADPARAPSGQHTLWAYCHVPHGSRTDATAAIEGQFDRFAPGWRDLVLQRATTDTAALEAYNANDVGGDISGGAPDGLQLLFRPVPKLHPYRTSIPDVYLCSSSTPPGGGVHGMCGYHAARDALAHSLGG
ncbi:MAG: NAD(P)/FAD-dependent oxidoreductase [Dehalococcoidia bacterium]|nr:NAD(P)/FAD-dependent oxidoreductase [Dehalococcoidia bacterium]